MKCDQIRTTFRFLTNRGFVEAAVQTDVRWRSVRVAFEGPLLRIEACYNDRDSFDCGVAFLRHAGASVSVGTLIQALRRDEAGTARSSVDALQDQAKFVDRHLEKLSTLPPDVLKDCRALRFHHAGVWRKNWGRAIQMDAETVRTEMRRLAHIIHVLRRERAQGASDQRLAEEGRLAAC